MKKTLQERLNRETLIFDGAMGTQLQAAGLKIGGIPEELNIDASETIIAIHETYLKAGADFITTNTFGCNRLKMQKAKYSVGEMLKAAVENAKTARKNAGREDDAYIALDIGPIGQMLRPLGTLAFDDAYDIIAEQIDAVKDEVDVILFETMTDLYEVKAGILAAREHSDLPIFTTMTFEKSGRTLTGTDTETFVTFAESMGVSALGVNCSLGPDELAPIIENMLILSHVPVLIQPNAGLPNLKHGETVYELSPEDFSDTVKTFAEKGAAICGGCCGTSPGFIRQLKEKLPKTVAPRDTAYQTKVTSGTMTKTFRGQVLICGERMNPTGKKKLQAALREERYDVLLNEAVRQEEAGADILDLNVGLPGIDESETMKKVIPMIQELVSLPLQLDSSSAAALETACRYYNGKPLINSVNGKDEVLDAVLPIVKKYGGAVIGLTLGEEIPLYAEERVAIAKKIIDRAAYYGIRKEDVLIDCLTLTASAQQKEVRETLRAVKMIREMGHETVLGVSNVSFGFPNRPLLNRTFLTLAIEAGLTLPIMNPLDGEMMGAIDAVNVLYNFDEGAAAYIERHANDVVAKAGGASGGNGGGGSAAGNAAGDSGAADNLQNSATDLDYLIRRGMKDQIQEATKTVLQSALPMTIVNETIIPALNRVGKDYESGKIFLPQLLSAAETTKLAFDIVQERIAGDGGAGEKKGPVLIATVEGDIHDIGKNIVKVVLESYGYDMVDLGKDVKIQDVVSACEKYQPKALGLSALMTTTVVNMEKTIKAVRAANITCPIMVGGAVLTQRIADEIGADAYAEDAMGAVRVLEELL